MLTFHSSLHLEGKSLGWPGRRVAPGWLLPQDSSPICCHGNTMPAAAQRGSRLLLFLWLTDLVWTLRCNLGKQNVTSWTSASSFLDFSLSPSQTHDALWLIKKNKNKERNSLINVVIPRVFLHCGPEVISFNFLRFADTSSSSGLSLFSWVPILPWLTILTQNCLFPFLCFSLMYHPRESRIQTYTVPGHIPSSKNKFQIYMPQYILSWFRSYH